MPLIITDWDTLSIPLLLATERPWLSTTLLLLGSWSVVSVLAKTLIVLTQTFVLQGKSLKSYGARKGAWAVVTGASDGIGQEFAVQLAKAGFNILLVARNPTALAVTAQKIEDKKYGVQTKIQLIDFALGEPAAYESLAETCKELDIGVLVNNVGKSHDMPVDFAELSSQERDDIVTINIAATLKVTAIVLPSMIQKKRGLVISVGSFAGAVPAAMLSVYSGTKAFLSTWSDALAEEVREHNITVQHVNTYFVVSRMSKIRRASAIVPTPAAYVRSTLAKLTLPCGAAFSGRPATSTPYWTHALADWALTLIGWQSLYIWYGHRMHKDIRKRALRKREREAKKQ